MIVLGIHAYAHDPAAALLELTAQRQKELTVELISSWLAVKAGKAPLLLVVEDLHWIDAETQALLDSLVESLPTARLLLLVNYRPEYQHGWGSKTYYTQLRLDPLPPASADEVLQALLGDRRKLFGGLATDAADASWVITVTLLAAAAWITVVQRVLSVRQQLQGT